MVVKMPQVNFCYNQISLLQKTDQILATVSQIKDISDTIF